jgi:hypothetical protein
LQVLTSRIIPVNGSTVSQCNAKSVW